MDKDRIGMILAGQARLETLAAAHKDDLVELKEVTTKRLDAHSLGIQSLNKTRDRQWGITKGFGIIGTLAGVVLAWLRYG